MITEANGEKQRERERERFENDMLLALKMEEGFRNQGMWAALRSWKRKGNAFCPGAS